MRISVIFRTHAGDNLKRRPEWYDRAACLSSLFTALEGSGVPTTVTFLVDGGSAPWLEPLVRPQDETMDISGGSAAASLREAVRVARTKADDDPDDTVYWFAEDDYLYRPESMAQLVAAAAAFDADYFALYVPDDSDWHTTHRSQPYVELTATERVGGRVGDALWHRTRQTTSTFAVRRDALRGDSWILRFGSTVGAPFDGATWCLLQKVEPFSWRHVAADLDGYWSMRGVAKVAAKPVMRVLANLVARLRPGRRRVLMAPRRDLCMHLEWSVVPPDQGWEAVARLA